MSAPPDADGVFISPASRALAERERGSAAQKRKMLGFGIALVAAQLRLSLW